MTSHWVTQAIQRLLQHLKPNAIPGTPLWQVPCQRLDGSIRVVHEITGMLGIGAVRLPKPLLPLEPSACAEIEAALACIIHERENSFRLRE